MTEKEFEVKYKAKMSCSGCSNAISRVVNKINNEKKVKVNEETVSCEIVSVEPNLDTQFVSVKFKSLAEKAGDVSTGIKEVIRKTGKLDEESQESENLVEVSA